MIVRGPWSALLAGTLAVFGALGLARFGYSVILPAMQAGLGLDNTEAGCITTASLTGYLMFSLLGGILAARFGPKRVIVSGLLITGGSMILTGTAHGFWSAVCWNCLAGLGSGASNVAVMGMWAAWFPPHRRGFASGVAVTGSSLGLMVSGPLVPVLLNHFGAEGWRICWYCLGAVVLLVALLCLLLIGPGARGQGPLSGPAGRAVGVGRDPFGWSMVYRSAAVWRLGLVYIAFGFSYIIYMTFFVKRLVAEGGYSREAAGNLFMTMGWASLVCGLLWGGISDRIGRRWALVSVYLLHAISFALFAFAPVQFGFTASALLFGISAWSIPAIMASACGDVLGARLAPAALGFITLFFGVGQVLGPAIAGALADWNSSFAPAYQLASLVAFLGAAGACTLRPHITDQNRSNAAGTPDGGQVIP